MMFSYLVYIPNESVPGKVQYDGLKLKGIINVCFGVWGRTFTMDVC